MTKNFVIEQTSSEDLLKQISNLIDEKLNSFFPNGFKNLNEDKTELLTIEETAKLLKVCKTTIYNYTKQGILKRKGAGKTTRYDKREVLERIGALNNQNAI
jgi:predicted DNA-binding transcriptional regulator AlpA